MKTVFTTGDVSKICKVAPRTVSKWFDSGSLEGFRIPGSPDRRVPLRSLIRFMLDHGMPLGELEGAIHHRIMLIGCDESLIQSILSILKGPKYEILSASTGFEAGLEEARRRSDCVVIDLSIGIGQARTIVENIRKKEIDEGPIVFAIRHDECEAEVFACGFLDCMRKPIEPKALAERLSALISTRKGDAFVDLF